MSSNLCPIPEANSHWKHHSGRVYRVVVVANLYSNRPEEYPLTVVYAEPGSDRVWSRLFCDWHRSMVLLPNYEADPVDSDAFGF